MDIADVLDRAADLIEPEGAWVKEKFALSRLARTVLPNSKRAVCFCGIGAVMHVMNVRSSYSLAWEYEERLERALGCTIWEFFEWNDAPERTQAEVVSALREAASKARAINTQHVGDVL